MQYYHHMTRRCICVVRLPAGRAIKETRKKIKKFCKSIKTFVDGEWGYVRARNHYTDEVVGGFACSARDQRDAERRFSAMYNKVVGREVFLRFEDTDPFPITD